MLYSYINAFACSWYIRKTYHSPVKVHVIAYWSHIVYWSIVLYTDLVYWSRMGRNPYGANTYLLSSFSRNEELFRTRAVATSLVTSHQNHSNLERYYAVLLRLIMEQFLGHSFHSSQ